VPPALADRPEPTDADHNKFFKIAFDLPVESDDWPPVAYESLWATKTGSRLHARVQNIPFFVMGVAFHDEILVRPDHGRRELVYERVVSPSGHSTIRIMLMTDDVRPTVEQILDRCGCPWEVALHNLVAVDIPSDVDYSALCSELLELHAGGQIGIQESALAPAHAGQTGE